MARTISGETSRTCWRESEGYAERRVVTIETHAFMGFGTPFVIEVSSTPNSVDQGLRGLVLGNNSECA